MGGGSRAFAWASRNWFFAAFAVVVAASYGFARSRVFLEQGGEAAILADLCLTVPLIYLWCYRNILSRQQLATGAAALACLGVWIAGRLIPAAEQVLLPHLTWVRTLGLAVLALIELRILVAVVRLAFSRTANAEEISAHSGAPPLLVRLMLLEVRFWRWVWKLLRSR